MALESIENSISADIDIWQAVALIGFGVLMFARFPREGSHRLDQEDTSTSAT